MQIAAWHLDSDQCHSCGRPKSECSDPKRVWYPQRTVCYSAMETAGANALYNDLHKERPYHSGDFSSWSKERSAEFPYGHRDGVTINASTHDLKPDDKFLG